MKKILTLSLIYQFLFSFSCKAQTIVSDSLERTVIEFLKKKENNPPFEYLTITTYSIPSNKYIVYLHGLSDKLCKESSSSVYKISNFKNEVNLYWINNFIPPIELNEQNTNLFLTDEECIKNTETVYTSIITMLLIDSKFAIEKEVKGISLQALKEDLLCPTSPISIERARVRKKYGKLQ